LQEDRIEEIRVHHEILQMESVAYSSLSEIFVNGLSQDEMRARAAITCKNIDSSKGQWIA
jgi:hypothetical protein